MKITDTEKFGVVDLLLTQAAEELERQYDAADDPDDWASTIAGYYSAAMEYAINNLPEESLHVASYYSDREEIAQRMQGMKIHSNGIRTTGLYSARTTVLTDGEWYVVEYRSNRLRILYDTQDADRAHAIYLILVEADQHAAGGR